MPGAAGPLFPGCLSEVDSMTNRTLWTIGHSTRSLGELTAILEAHHIEAVVDVRRFPASRRHPQFHAADLEQSLSAHHIGYVWIGALGGRRRVLPDSPNDGWRHVAFRGYADYIATEEFATGLFELQLVASGLNTAIMCAEVLWWRCHRRLIADVMTLLGWRVMHIYDAAKAEEHRLTLPAHVVDGRLSYAER
jgi:uncharacterized protein (DUF488 family)